MFAVTPALVVLAIVVVTGAAYVAEPLPGVVALAARLAGSILGGYLIWVSLRGAPPPTIGWRIGFAGAAAIAIVAFAIGWLASGTIAGVLAVAGGEGPRVGAAAALAAGSPVPRAAFGAALALGALAAAPVLVGRDVLRLGLGLLLLLAAVGLLRNAMAVTTDGPVELSLAVLTALSGAAIAATVGRSLAVHGDLELRMLPRESIFRRRSTDEAHPRPWPGAFGPYGPRRIALPPMPRSYRDLRRRPEPPKPARPEPPTPPSGKGGYGSGWPGMS